MKRLERLRLRIVSPAGMAIVLVVLALAAVVGVRRSLSSPSPREALYTVVEGPLTISVTESGTIQSRDKVIVRSAVEGRNTILFIIPEGRIVQPGDLLVELDSSALQERLAEQALKVENSAASLTQAREKLAVTRNQAQADVEKAELDLRFARLNLEKYIEGEHPREVRQAEAEIAIAAEELKRAEDKLTWSKSLAEEGYITRSELQGDELALQRATLNLELAKNKLDLIQRYTHVETAERRKSEVWQAEMALERVRRRTASDIIQAEVEVRARDADYERQKTLLEKLRGQIEACRITAPASGMVVYATSVSGRRWGQEPLAEGQQVIERQELIYLPADEAMMAEIRLPESSLSKIREGLPARVRVDAFPDRVISGVLQKIAVLPDASRSWLNPDLKVYVCEIHFSDSLEGLRPGMNCTAEIIIEAYDKAHFVPLSALTRVEGKPAVYVMTPTGPAPRVVEAGLDNNRMVHIKAGLKPGEAVLLAPPLPQDQTPAFNSVMPVSPPSPGPSSASPTPQTPASGERRGNGRRAEGKPQ
jgi:HlyD family secretion protein